MITSTIRELSRVLCCPACNDTTIIAHSAGSDGIFDVECAACGARRICDPSGLRRAAVSAQMSSPLADHPSPAGPVRYDMLNAGSNDPTEESLRLRQHQRSLAVLAENVQWLRDHRSAILIRRPAAEIDLPDSAMARWDDDGGHFASAPTRLTCGAAPPSHYTCH